MDGDQEEVSKSFPDPAAGVRWALDIEREMIGHGWIKAF
jgi:hypothetical protein